MNDRLPGSLVYVKDFNDTRLLGGINLHPLEGERRQLLPGDCCLVLGQRTSLLVVDEGSDFYVLTHAGLGWVWGGLLQELQ